MKKRLAILTILAACVATLMSGCDPTNLDNDGKQVRFTARSREFPSTKTGYSAYVTENNTLYQRIDWHDGDVLRIYSPKDEGNLWSPNMELQATNIIADNPYLKLVYSDYQLRATDDNGEAAISVDPADSRFSVAKLFNNGDNGLTWSGNAATFYGAYPVRDDRLIPHALDVDGETLQHLLMEIKIPGAKAQNAGTDADGQTGDSTFVSTMPLLAKNGPLTSGSQVKLDFYPYFSAFEFNLKSKDTQELTIESLKLEAQEGYISGHLYWDLTANTLTDLGSLGTNLKSITVPVGKTVSSTTDANVTIFGLPNDLKKMTLTIKFTMSGNLKATATLYLGDDTVFGARKKTRIKGLQMNGQWKIFIAAVDIDDWEEVGTTTLIM